MKIILTFLIGLVTAIFDAAISAALRFLPCADFDATNMNRIQVGTCTLWIYKSVTAIATVIGSGYFNDISDQFNKGDIIICSDTNVPTIDMITITSADKAATVTTLNGT